MRRPDCRLRPPTQRAKRVCPRALRGERIVFGGVNCYATGSRLPLVLVHSINAASSAAEMWPLFEHCSATHTVFAIELPDSASANGLIVATIRD